jgi:hypothetical protein
MRLKLLHFPAFSEHFWRAVFERERRYIGQTFLLCEDAWR